MGIGKDLFGNRTWQCQDINWAHAECVQHENKCKGHRLKKGQTLSGVVKNVCQFGVFVDVGVETSGLVHRSTFIEQDFANKTKKAGVKVEPHDVARAGEKVTVRVGNVDLDRKRLELFFVR